MDKLIFPIILIILSCSQPTKTDSQWMYSEYLEDSIPYNIREPDYSNMTIDSLNLLVLLDGDEYFGIASNVLALYEFDERVFPTLVISLPSTMKSRWLQYTPTSTQDPELKTGAFKKFANFINLELIPKIENNVGITFINKAIFGHSMGGLAALSFMSLQAETFNRYIIASPATMYDEHYILNQIESYDLQKFKKLHLSAAENDANGYKENTEWLYEYLKVQIKNPDNLSLKIYPNQTHSTSGILSLIDGIEFIFSIDIE